MSALEHEWPDEDRRHDALIRALCEVYSYDEDEHITASETRVSEGLLTARQARILGALSRGMGDQGAADLIGISVFTLKGDTKIARRALRAKNTTHACCETVRKGPIR